MSYCKRALTECQVRDSVPLHHFKEAFDDVLVIGQIKRMGVTPQTSVIRVYGSSEKAAGFGSVSSAPFLACFLEFYASWWDISQDSMLGAALEPLGSSHEYQLESHLPSLGPRGKVLA